jgi:hypothetical protein
MSSLYAGEGGGGTQERKREITRGKKEVLSPSPILHFRMLNLVEVFKIAGVLVRENPL